MKPDRIPTLFPLHLGKQAVGKGTTLQVPAEGKRLSLKCRLCGVDHRGLRPLHGEELLPGELQELLQGELLIDGVRAVERCAVRPLHAGDAGFEVLVERVVLQRIQVVESHVGGQLELQHGTALPKVCKELSSLCGL